MKILLFAVVSLILCISCNYTTREEVLKELEEHEWDVLDHKEWPYMYYVEDLYSDGNNGWVTFKTYMWNYGFPDTIIVKFTRDGEFEWYTEAHRWDVVKDSFGEHLTPSYIFSSALGDSWTYDLHGHFLSFGEDTIDNPTRERLPEYHP